MNSRLNLLKVFLLSLIIVSCSKLMPKEKTESEVNVKKLLYDPPAWILQGNVYEVNVRQYTPEGTLAAFAKHLDRLKEMGVQTLWFMPINPIGKVDRKGALGSYYAVSNYTAFNPEFGTMDEWKAFVKKAHEMNFKVII